MHWRHISGSLPLDRPRIVGIVNVTPDSFSDGGRLGSVDDARRLAETLVREGADALDLGAESTRPGAMPVSEDEERRRAIPVIEAIVRDLPGVPLSIDTVKASVAGEALDAGAVIVNDVSAFRLDPAMAALCATRGAGVVLMHSRGGVGDMASFAHAVYGRDPVDDVIDELRSAVARAEQAGIGREHIVIDPGVGFAKRAEQSLRVLGELARIAALRLPVMVGVSRKRFIGEVTGVREPAARLHGTVGANVAALERGARLFRVHDVQSTREALDVAWAIHEAGNTEPA